MTDITDIWAYDFMRHAFIAGTIASIVAAAIGYFIVLRRQHFAGHALSHIGFTGSAGAGLVGLAPSSGQLILTLLAAIGMGSLGERASKSDTAIGIVLAFALGLGVLFLYFYHHYAGQAMVILFGDLLGISPQMIKTMLIYAALSLLGLACIARPLLFTTLEPELAEAKGVSLQCISILFFILTAVAITEASQVVGILLVFTLLIGPAAGAIRCTHSFYGGLSLSIILGILMTWIGIILAYFTNWPVSFWISSLSLLSYFLCIIISMRRQSG